MNKSPVNGSYCKMLKRLRVYWHTEEVLYLTSLTHAQAETIIQAMKQIAKLAHDEASLPTDEEEM